MNQLKNADSRPILQSQSELPKKSDPPQFDNGLLQANSIVIGEYKPIPNFIR